MHLAEERSVGEDQTEVSLQPSFEVSELQSEDVRRDSPSMEAKDPWFVRHLEARNGFRVGIRKKDGVMGGEGFFGSMTVDRSA